MNPTFIPDINCDLGEGIPDESLIYPWIDSASIACGGHFGNKMTIRESLHLAKKFGVKVGAHPSYPDRENFGRNSIVLPFPKLEQALLEQIRLFRKICDELQLSVDHLKFHGALYNDAARNPILAKSLVQMLQANYPGLTVFVPPHSEMEKYASELGLPTRLEVFGDRSYQDNYLLVGRTQPKALLSTIEEVESQLSALLNGGHLVSISGKTLPVSAETICFHGDNPGILEFLPHIRKKFWSNRV